MERQPGKDLYEPLQQAWVEVGSAVLLQAFHGPGILVGARHGECLAYRMARRLVFELVSSTLEAALSRTRCAAELIVHSDQGWHYKMQPYRAMLAKRGVKQSMSRKGNCFDNAVIESFFGTLKAEYFHLAAPNSIDALEAGVHDYAHYYNHGRIKLGLQGLSPVEFRLRSTA